MTTLITASNSEGVYGRCDAKSYDATQPDCDCICGSINHGVGYRKAIENNTERWGHMVEQHRSRRPDAEMVRTGANRQPPLFE